MTVPTSPSLSGLVAAVMVAVTVVVVTPIARVGPREDTGWDKAGCWGGPGAEGGARLPTPTWVSPRDGRLRPGPTLELEWGSPGEGSPRGVPTVGLNPRTPKLVPGEGRGVDSGIDSRVTAEPLAGADCGDRGMWEDPGLPCVTPPCATGVLPGARGPGGCPGMADGLRGM